MTLSSFWNFLTPLGKMVCLMALFLVIASVGAVVLNLIFKKLNTSHLNQRIRAWWIISILFFAAVGSTNFLAVIFFMLLSFWAMKEYVTLIQTRPSDYWTLGWIFLSIPIQYYWVATNWFGMFIIFIPIYMFLWLPTRLVLSKQPKAFLAKAALLQWGMMAFVFGLSHLAALIKLDPPLVGEATGRSLLLFLVFISEVNNVFQTMWGKLFGQMKIIPTINPNKTWEGFLGGIFSTMAIGSFFRFLTPFSFWECASVVVMICVSGFLGGTTMAAIKRQFGVKNLKSPIPGHGALIERIDELCFSAPILFHYIRHFYT